MFGLLEPLLSVRKLSKTYGPSRALQDLSFDAYTGEILALVGANGAGKTTTFRLVAGLCQSSGGAMVLDGVDISDHRVDRRSLGALIEGPGTYGHLSAEDNLRILSWTAGHRIAKTEIDQLLELVGLPTPGGRRVDKLSTGMRQRLAIAIALLGAPKLLILDEPTSGLDAIGILEIRQLIKDLAGNGLTILWASHNLREVEQICSRLIWLQRGELKYYGDVNGLPRGKEVLELTVADAESALQVLAETAGSAGLMAVPGGVRVAGIAMGVVIQRLTAAGIEISDLNKVTTNLEDIFAAHSGESTYD